MTRYTEGEFVFYILGVKGLRLLYMHQLIRMIWPNLTKKMSEQHNNLLTIIFIKSVAVLLIFFPSGRFSPHVTPAEKEIGQQINYFNMKIGPCD